MNRDTELIDRRIVMHEAIVATLRALRSDFEAEGRTAAETTFTASATSKPEPPLCPPAATLDIQAETGRLRKENARINAKAPAKRQPPKPPTQHSASLRDRMIEHLSNRAMSGTELAHATGYSQVSIYKALRSMRVDGIVATREESDRTKKNFLLSRTGLSTRAGIEIAATSPIGESSSPSPAPGSSPVPRPIAVRRPHGRPKAPVRPSDPPPPPGLSIRDQIINLLLTRPMTSAELIKAMGCIPNSAYDVLAKMRSTGVVEMRHDPTDGVRKNYLTTQSGRMTPEPQPAATPEP